MSNSTSQSTPVTRALNALHIPYRAFRHPGPIHSLAQAAQERGQQPDQVVRSLVFRLGKTEYVMVLMNGPRQVSWPVLRHYLGQSRLTLATEAELLEATGYEVGAVSPLGLPQPMRILVDEQVFEQEEISLGSGVRGLSLILKTADLRRALGEIETGSFAV